MKLSFNWLKEYVNTKFSAEEIADKLTMAGLEVDEVISGHTFSGVVVGKVVSLDKHPNADKLRVARVDVGTEILQIVCGAANLEKGQTVPVAIVGAKLGDFEIGKASLRGVDSYGMICSERELGLGEDHSGIMVLEKGNRIGEIFVSEKGSDKVIDVSVLANRPDCMSVIGLAREVSVLTGEKLTLPKVKFAETTSNIQTKVTIEDSDLCPRYVSRIVSGVKKAETPVWMKERLLSSGVRSIDLFVDISNYVMLEYGQPLHFFDMDKVSDSAVIDITVRRAKKGEKLVTLDGVSRSLTEEMLVIATKKEAVALAGVMGGSTTEIDKKTENIFIEAAVFDKASIRRTSRALGLRSEAVARYEKGISLATPEMAIDRAAQLLSELASGKIIGKKSDTLKVAVKQKKISLNPSRLNMFLGTSYTDKQIQSVLRSLGFEVTIRTKYLFEVTVPLWRVDIEEAVDLYEEVCRIIGFDSVPSTLPYDVHCLSLPNKFYEFSSMVRRRLAAIGLSEIMTYSFAGEKELSATGTDMNTVFEVANPLVKEQRYMRTSLVPKMLDSLASNQFLSDSVRFFELGKTFHRSGKGLPEEKSWICIGVLGGSSWPIVYKEGSDYYDAKGVVENLLSTLGVEEFTFKAFDNALFTSGRSAEIFSGNTLIGCLGIVSANLGSTFGLKKSVAIAVIDQDTLLSLVGKDKVVKNISKYQHSIRDISFIISDKVESATLLDSISKLGGLLQGAEIVDIYQGKPLENTDKSVTVRLTIVSDEGTLTDADVDQVVTQTQLIIGKLGGVVRGGKN
jgi:phenylalanyl-tRNA synthetase beta chain